VEEKEAMSTIESQQQQQQKKISFTAQEIEEKKKIEGGICSSCLDFSFFLSS
jgi:hypothetical protein